MINKTFVLRNYARLFSLFMKTDQIWIQEYESIFGAFFLGHCYTLFTNRYHCIALLCLPRNGIAWTFKGQLSTVICHCVIQQSVMNYFGEENDEFVEIFLHNSVIYSIVTENNQKTQLEREIMMWQRWTQSVREKRKIDLFTQELDTLLSLFH